MPSWFGGGGKGLAKAPEPILLTRLTKSENPFLHLLNPLEKYENMFNNSDRKYVQ